MLRWLGFTAFVLLLLNTSAAWAACPSQIGQCVGGLSYAATLTGAASDGKQCVCLLAVTNTRKCRSSCAQFMPSTDEGYECRLELNDPCNKTSTAQCGKVFTIAGSYTQDACDNVLCPAKLQELEADPSPLTCDPTCPTCAQLHGVYGAHYCNYLQVPERPSISFTGTFIDDTPAVPPTSSPAPVASPSSRPTPTSFVTY